VYTFQINPEWNEDAFERLFDVSIEKIRLTFPHLTDEQLKAVCKKQLSCLDTLVVGYKDGVEVMMTSGVQKNRDIYFVSLLFGKVDNSRDFIYSDEYLTAGFAFLNENFDSFTQNEPEGSSVCDYMDMVNDTKVELYGDDTEELITSDSGDTYKKRVTVKNN
jgi:hypothetical protein